ncbi:MAG: NAD(P)H-hydrate dehydratase [Gemmatimonadaceae bacterium]
MSVFVATASEAAARDQAAISAGTPSKELMRRAGECAARAIWSRFGDACERGVEVFTGPGNNGGDGWIIAFELQRLGASVVVDAVSEPVTLDAQWARAQGALASRPGLERPGVVVDALLGTGARGEPRGAIGGAVRRIAERQREGAIVMAMDLPTGLDATTGAATLAVRADFTAAFGTWKRGLLARRDLSGELVCLDIGLGDGTGPPDEAAMAIDATWTRRVIPPITADAHKGTRKRVMIVGAAPGMAGASILAARGAFRSGVGMVRCCAHPDSIVPLQASSPSATVLPWPAPDEQLDASDLRWPHGLLIGPGFGLGSDAVARARHWLEIWRGPVVVDADLLTLFAGDASALGARLRGRAAIATPHTVEAARLLGCAPDDVLADRYAAAAALADALEATVLLKGVPTIIASPGERTLVSARGTPVLGTGGSGDLLAGIVVTLLAQMERAHDAAAAAAFVHGRAAEIANAGRPVRGVTLDDVVNALGVAWRLDPDVLESHELAWLPAVGERPPA